ncbi:hypothetical protein [Candidatus Sororendozoicomonas aggregata]|uniref:hypothetical protein n=1 Tax=Candidatus Sororendozoicomonas aggregata TaxID=3073239 RepID=UPI002ED08637
MNNKIHLLLMAMAVSTSASAASISFTQPAPPAKIKTPITVTARGITGLERPVKAAGKFQIQNDGQKKVIGTKVVINNMKGGYPQIETGSIDWSQEGVGASNKYTFILSAGGYPKSADKKQDYCVTVTVDGKKVGKKCTSHKAFWDPTTVKHIPITSTSNIAVSFSYPS